MPASGKRRPDLRGQRLVGFEQHFAGLAIDQIGDGVGAFEVGERNVHLGDLGLYQFLVERLGDAPVRRDQHFVGSGSS